MHVTPIAMAFIRWTLFVCALASPYFALAATIANEVAPLFQWLSKKGGASSLHCTVSGGIRGLIATRNAEVGDVLLEVPLAATLADGASGSGPARGLTVAGPAWAQDLPWNVQLALGALQRRADPEWSAFLSSWPEAAPVLPKDFDSEELEEAQDEDFEVKAESTYFWMEEQYENAREAHEAAGASEGFPTEEEFRWALAHVWSRCCRFDLGTNGVRRLLVPIFDLCNHEPVPSAVFSYTEAAGCGPAIRLYAARPIRVGEPVTITYGEHPTTEFILYYGFVPQVNPFDVVQVSLEEVLSSLPTSFATPPQGGWEKVIRQLEIQGQQVRSLPLKANAPAEPLLQALCTVFQDGVVSEMQVEERAVRAISLACAALEAAYDSSVDEDETLLGTSAGVTGMSVGVLLLVQYRLSRKRLLRQVGQNMQTLAEEYAVDPSLARQHLEELRTDPAVYPSLKTLPSGELEDERWSKLAWDWTTTNYVGTEVLA